MVTARIAAYLKNNGWVLNLVFIALGSYFVRGAVNAVVAEEIRLLPNANQHAANSSRPSSVVNWRSPKTRDAQKRESTPVACARKDSVDS